MNRAAFFRKKEHKPEFIESDEFRMCARKEKFRTERVAQKAADKHLTDYGTKLRVYKCNFCKQFHLTKKDAY